ncbi:MAG: carbon-phosphorus lyase [Chloroflexi bacterium]|nr:carbon-phosphorus lyase [Chloroflexota bacterium]
MDILICGTAAAEGWPALFCHCGPCGAARSGGGKNIRSRAAYQVGETIRIDFGPDSNLHQQRYGLAFERLRHLLVSHSHWDHWTPQDLNMRRKGFAMVPDDAILNIYGNEKVQEKLNAVIGADGLRQQFLTFRTLKAWEPIALDNGITATPLVAAHDRSELCVNWMLEQGGRRFLQGHDTGWWPDETWDYLREHPADVVVMDCTYGSVANRSGHLGCADVLEVRDRLRASGGLLPSARFVATHFSHNGAWLHDRLEEFFAPHGIEVAYDGMALTV